MINRTIVLLLFILLAGLSEVSGQRDIIRLTNGSVIRGTVSENMVDEYAIIRLLDSQSIRVLYPDIVMLRHGESRYFGTWPISQRGYFKYTTIGIILHRGDDSENSVVTGLPTFQTINGWVYRYYLKPGVGIGYDGYPNLNTIPLFLNLQGELINRKVTPVYTLGTGYGFTFGKDEEFGQVAEAKGGLFLQTGLGLMIHGAMTGFVLGVDYKLQKADLVYNDWFWGGTLTEKRTFRNISVKFGFQF